MVYKIGSLNVTGDGNKIKERKLTSAGNNGNIEDRNVTVNEPLPVVEENKTEDIDAPVEGYHIEITSPVPVKDDEKDDDDDTSVKPQKIRLENPSIALNQISNKLTTALEQAVDRASQTGVDDNDKTDIFFTQAQNMAEVNDENAIFNIDFKKKFNVYGKAVYEDTNHTYSDDEETIKMRQNSKKIEVGGTYSNQSGSTKAVFLATATKTNYKLNMTMQGAPSEETIYSELPEDIDDEDIEIIVDDEGNSETKTDGSVAVYNAYIAAQHKFKNGDIISGNVLYNKDGVQLSRTTAVNADYYLSKFGAHLTGGATIYKGAASASTVQTNFDCTFNPEMEEDKVNQSLTNDTNVVEDSNREVSDNNVSSEQASLVSDKLNMEFSPFFDTNSIEGSPEEGLGIRARLKKSDENTFIKFTGFGKVSTTQKENQKSLYHLTGGVGASYIHTVGKDGVIKAKADLRDKFTFGGGGNILTATGSLSYSTPKVLAEVEGSYYSIPSSTYAGIVGRVSYTPTKNIHTYAEASYVDWKYPDGRLNGNSINMGVLVNF